jgi:hypothetical protein
MTDVQADGNLPYESLPSNKHFRILALEPSTLFEAPLTCVLRTQRLGNADRSAEWQPYQALSYVWGAPEAVRPLQCNGKTVHVTENCDSALRHLRQLQNITYLWIDAICINQTSLQERAQQVKIMGDIYDQANSTIVWLGPDQGDAAMLFKYLKKAASMLRKLRRWRFIWEFQYFFKICMCDYFCSAMKY